MKRLEGGHVSSQELQGKFTFALAKISREAVTEGAKRHKPIYERNSQQSERHAIAEAADALTALWKLRTTSKF